MAVPRSPTRSPRPSPLGADDERPRGSEPQAAPAALGTVDEIIRKARGENFPVASLVLPRRARRALAAIYGFARLVDDTGDLVPGDRLALLDWLEADLERAFAGEGDPRHPLLRRLSVVLRENALPREPFLRLIEANRRDQTVTRYASWTQLADYCRLSANPVGELVLHLLGSATPERLARSDAVCTALQLAEHLQDVGEDMRRGRIYLPQDDMSRFGVTEAEIDGSRPAAALQRLLAFEVERARGLLAHGPELVASLSGWGRLAVAAYVGGGRAALDAIERSGYDVLVSAPRATRAARMAATAGVLREAGRASAAADAAYRHCRLVTSRNASSFYHGIRLLPGSRRKALFAVYALARRIDDIADGAGANDEKLRRLAQARGDLASIAVARDDPVLVALADAASRFPVPLEAFGDLIDGAEMDVRGVRYETFDDLLVYCRRVAGSIGRLSLGVFGAREPARAAAHAEALGVALQLTNILRDVRDDLALGRVYVPQEDVRRFGCELSPVGSNGPFAELIRFEARRARRWFDEGLELLPLLDRRSAACVAAMAGVYSRLLARIEGQPELVLEGRITLPRWEKGWTAVRGLVAASP
jgi:15-cis-phytoene synthase